MASGGEGDGGTPEEGAHAASQVEGPDPDPGPEPDHPSFHDAFKEDRRRAYAEFAATGLLFTGTLLAVAWWLRPDAPGSDLGLGLGLAFVLVGIVLFWREIRKGREEEEEAGREGADAQGAAPDEEEE